MEEMRKFENTVDYLSVKKPAELAKVVKQLSREYPETIKHLMYHVTNGDHITNHNEYYKLVDGLKWKDDSGHGERFKLDDAIRMAEKLAKIDFEYEEYTEYDFAFTLNLIYAIWCKNFKETTTFLKLTKDLYDYFKVNKEPEFGAFFRPIKNHHQQYDYRSESEYRRGYPRNDSEYRYDEENRRGYPRNDDNNYDRRGYKNEYDNKHNDSEYRH